MTELETGARRIVVGFIHWWEGHENREGGGHILTVPETSPGERPFPHTLEQLAPVQAAAVDPITDSTEAAGPTGISGPVGIAGPTGIADSTDSSAVGAAAPVAPDAADTDVASDDPGAEVPVAEVVSPQ